MSLVRSISVSFNGLRISALRLASSRIAPVISRATYQSVVWPGFPATAPDGLRLACSGFRRFAQVLRVALMASGLMPVTPVDFRGLPCRPPYCLLFIEHVSLI